jgi:hypothetical protein
MLPLRTVWLVRKLWAMSGTRGCKEHGAVPMTESVRMPATSWMPNLSKGHAVAMAKKKKKTSSIHSRQTTLNMCYHGNMRWVLVHVIDIR